MSLLAFPIRANAIAGPSRLLPVGPTLGSLRLTRPRFLASVADPSGSDVIVQASSPSSSRQTPAQRARNSNASPADRQSLIQAAKERKMKEYEALLKQKAAERGLKSVEELKARVMAEKASAKLATNAGATPPPASPIEERDAKVAAQIRARAEAEAKRKLSSGELSGGKSAIKPLGDILNLEKLMEEPPEKIHQLWTAYHSLKNKLSAVIPATIYQNLLKTAKRYPQFVLPLPRTVSVSDEAPDGEAGKEAQKQGYEMHFLEWAFLPPPPSAPSADQSSSREPPAPTTVLFTPLAEYKLRQEFAQPLLVLSHYTDLAATKGLVLMRGDITGVNEAEAAPTGVAAATAAKAAGASKEEQERLAQPLQSQGRMSQQDAQLLSMCMQRFYLPDVGKGDNSSRADVGAAERIELLEAFHREPEKFEVDKLVEAAFKF